MSVFMYSIDLRLINTAEHMEIIKKNCAKEQGMTYYFTGKSCKNGHIDKRFCVSGVCYSCHKQDFKRSYQKDPSKVLRKSKEYYSQHKENIIKQHKEWYKNNKDTHLRNMRAYYKENREQYLERSREWGKNNPDKSVQYHFERKLRIPKWTKNDPRIRFLYKRCKELNELWGTNMEVDHVIPLRGKRISGLHVWENLQLLDRPLNTKKGNRYGH